MVRGAYEYWYEKREVAISGTSVSAAIKMAREQYRRIDLAGMDLSGMDLQDAYLMYADLEGAKNLDKAIR